LNPFLFVNVLNPFYAIGFVMRIKKAKKILEKAGFGTET